MLPPDRSLVLGRDPRCEIVIDPNLYGGVSRRHAEIQPLAPTDLNSDTTWQICDLGSANGTFVNGIRIQGCRPLQPGDRLTLGINGPEFIYEYEATIGTQPAVNTPASAATSTTLLTFSQLIPIVSTGKDLVGKAYLVPAIATVIFVVMMFASLGQAQQFNTVLSVYLGLGAYYFIYKLCGKHKPWWVILGAAAITVAILLSPILNIFLWFFREVLPGGLPDPNKSVSLFTVFIAMFFGAGLMEELLKAIPIFVAMFAGLQFKMPWRERIGVWEPLDGILLGSASAMGFTLLETLGQYVPSVVQGAAIQSGNLAIGELTGLQLLIPRVLGSLAGHMAYSGYFGYFIGLSVLKPSKRWQILTVGFLSSSLLHALWNTGAAVSFWLLVVVGAVSYAFLAAAILKAHGFSAKARLRAIASQNKSN
jgi:RsiW-degrading membrane proteinase PrsW (M82 family)